MDEFVIVDHFQPHVGKTVRFKGTRFAIPLQKIILGQKFIADQKREPFMLIFRAPKEPDHLPEGYYECEIEDGPTYNIYVSPVHTPEPEWQDYQAIFN